ncbi:Dpi35p SCDLUD_002427 [Saccharomycodes ludwigii]|uniref:Dpi35p n=1 Tax=Saccharomycodes ludwigii TaxID=36035 RepID=UPI001E8838B4|nr:hypothetical protein SCDLUD_002427 [Saccharomycodes ludwigii]KAH3900965.1 hypothetical protein SCDLUD_002427 [Saccharomycodes ludwigii]
MNTTTRKIGCSLPLHLPKPKIITLDAYNTLYSTKVPVMQKYCEFGVKYGLDINIPIDCKKMEQSFPSIFKKINNKYPQYGKKCGLTPEEWWSKLIIECFQSVLPHISEKRGLPDGLLDDILASFETSQVYAIYPDLIPFLEYCKNNDIVLGIASNTDPIMCKLIRNLGIDLYFINDNNSNVYLSYDLEIKKPNKLFFDYILKRVIYQDKSLTKNMKHDNIDELKKHCYHIGDEKHNDMEGASNAGWNGILLDRMNKYGYFGTDIYKSKSSVPIETQLAIDKIDNNLEQAWVTCLQNKNKIITAGPNQFVISTFQTLTDLFQQQE